MAAARPLLWLALLTGILAASCTAGQPPDGRLLVVPTTNGALLTLACPQLVEHLELAIDGAPAAALPTAEPEHLPLSLAIVIELTAAMGEAGTPHSTRLNDALILAELLLDLAPRDTAVAIIGFDNTTASLVLPLTTDMAAARTSLNGLRTSSPGAPGTTSQANALETAVSELEGRSPAALITFTAGGPALAPALRNPALIGKRSILVNHSDQPIKDLSRTTQISFATTAITELPRLFQSASTHFRELLRPGMRLRLRLSTGELEAGPHTVEVAGCGEPLRASFEVDKRQFQLLPESLIALVFLLTGLALGWRLGTRTGHSNGHTSSKGRRPAMEQTTARRAAVEAPAPALNVHLWDGQRHREHTLEGRHWIVGSDPACDLCIASAGVAPLHTSFALAGNTIEVTALDGAVTLQGPPAQVLVRGLPEQVQAGAVLLIGPVVRITLEASPPEAKRGYAETSDTHR